MLSFTYKIENPVNETIEIKPGVYYSMQYDANESAVYRKTIVTENTIKWIAVQNNTSVISIGVTPDDDYIPYHIQQCFVKNKSYSTITEAEFKENFDVVLKQLNNILGK